MNYEEISDSQEKTVSPKIIHLGARGSLLSKWQANHITQKLEEAWPNIQVKTHIIQTEGDKVSEIPLPQIGGKGVFTVEIETALRENKIDFAVHSFKDLPVENNPGLTIAAISQREDPRDALVSRENYQIHTLPKGATVGTSSTRRTAQLLFLRPDLNIISIRGNVDTRIAKALNPSGPYDAIVLAYAGLLRVGLQRVVSEIVSLDHMLPAPAQGALAVQCKQNSLLHPYIEAINHAKTMLATSAERAFLKALGGGCSLPIAAYAECTDNLLTLRGNVLARNGGAKIDLEKTAAINISQLDEACRRARLLGEDLANHALSRGADKLLNSI